MTWLFPNSIALLSELTVSCQRIQVNLLYKTFINYFINTFKLLQKFLMLEEIETHENNSNSAKYSKSTNATKDDLIISVEDLTVKWDSVCFKTAFLISKYFT